MESRDKLTFGDFLPECLLTRIGWPYFRRDSAGGIIMFQIIIIKKIKLPKRPV